MLLPGFIDTHAHLLDTGLAETWINGRDVSSVKSLLERIHKRSLQIPTGCWIMVGNFDENFMDEKRLPYLDELDKIASKHPIYINHKSYHCSLANSKALALLNLDENIEGLGFDFSGKKRRGLLIKEANRLVKSKMASLVSVLDLDRAFEAVAKKAASVGLTTIHCVEGGDYWGDMYADYILNVEPTTFEPVLYFNTEDVSKIIQRGLFRMGGDILIDGSISNRSASFLESYSDEAETMGKLYHSQEEIRSLIRKAHLNNIQISFHAIGDKAIEELITAYEAVLTHWPRPDHRHRIEHFGIPLHEHILRAKRLGLAIATQPAFIYQKEETYRLRLDNKRFSRAYPLRNLISTGLLTGGGSDSMVSPLDPMFGIHAAVNHPNVEQRIFLEEAIKLYTIWAAALAFQENEKGSLQPGKLADMVVLEKDIRKVDLSEIKNVKISGTLYRGQVVYGFDW